MLKTYDRITDAVHGILDDLELGNLKLDTGETMLAKDITDYQESRTVKGCN